MIVQRGMFWMGAAVCAAVLLAGCARPPQIGGEHRKWIEALLTAVSSRNPTWVEATARRVSAAHDGGALPDEEFAAFDAIIVQARGGDWKGAEGALRKLAAAQQALPNADAHAAPTVRPARHARTAGR